MVARYKIIEYINQLLAIDEVKDYGPNGLQVEGRPDIHRVISAVTASQALLERAIEQSADLVLVHHGLYWGQKPQVAVGMLAKRLQLLLCAQVNLAAYHLPLDIHPLYGNHVQLAAHLRLVVDELLTINGMPGFIGLGHWPVALSPLAMSEHLAHKLQRKPLHIAGGGNFIRTVAWCTGAAQDMMQKLPEGIADAFLTGEASERTYHEAMELGMHFYAAGHHATERYGIATLGAHLADTFSIEHQFIDIDNPI